MLAVTLSAAPAAAHPLEQQLPTGADVCWSRQYDGAHLVKHPNQKVTAIALSKVRDDAGGGVIALTLQVNLRERAPINAGEVRHFDFASHVFCKPAGAGLACESEYGLGTFRIERSGSGLLVKNPGLLRFNPANHDAEELADNHIKVPARPDDAAWLLDTRGPKPCAF